MLFITTGRLFQATITMLRFTVVEVWVVLNSRLNRCFGKSHFMLDIIYGLTGAKHRVYFTRKQLMAPLYIMGELGAKLTRHCG